MTKGWKSSEFWTHIAVLAGALSTSIGTVFDHAFVANHPVLSAAIVVVSGAAAALSQAAYSIGRSLVKSAQEPQG